MDVGNTKRGADKEKGLREELEQTYNLLEQLATSLGGLTDLLEPVMVSDREEKGSGVAGAEKDVVYEAPLVSQVRMLNSLIGRRTLDIVRLQERIQL